jgi:hypothetical protein
VSSAERDDALERLRASVERMRARVRGLPVPPPAPMPRPTSNATPPAPWSETDREVGEEG